MSVGAVPEAGGADPGAVLAGGELEILGRIPTASNATLVCDAVLGDRRERCVYKPVRGEQPLWDFATGTLAGREVASYEICRALGWDVIPTTLLRDGPFGAGMVQRWIDTPDEVEHARGRLDVVDLCPEDAVPDGWRSILRALDADGDRVALVHADDPRLQRMAVLDVLINNADRKGGHVLEGVDGQIYGVDHGICLHHDDKLRTVLWGWAGEPIPAHLIADIEHFADDLAGARGTDLRDRLRPLISAEEVAALRDRAETLVSDPVMPTPDRARPIPWPAF
ncbi:SCO1664 family protein [Williamsia sterculiae]|uniref:Uncharacterized protein n=1 Tax=Williamsia sterculiae TaxID=1344003 RepID=A0A1N7ELS4_9NOCA|nr:SCO1664 family protein [Williamsia sterculiae]SIR89036.1 conserved hypothetical protein [Williamsia sterculiae]